MFVVNDAVQWDSDRILQNYILLAGGKLKPNHLPLLFIERRRTPSNVLSHYSSHDCIAPFKVTPKHTF